ncbi:hypothetical protein HMN09_00786900 [Mycena chlorophos]|uniref:Uncharacterized protein n=1 Tax=Mycena chlorophos TaxID=658473 RepID=A0A8H6SWT2_MYCCL|nr:hypothetical protein HMN09_00786900 [Mycena chlorophos]
MENHTSELIICCGLYLHRQWTHSTGGGSFHSSMFFESATVKKAATAKPNELGKEDVAPGVTRATKRARTSTTTSSCVGPSSSFQDASVGLQPALALADGTVSRKRKRTDSIVDDRGLRPTENVFTGGKLDIYAMSSITLRDALQPVTSSRLNYIALLRIIHEKHHLRSGEVDISAKAPTF